MSTETIDPRWKRFLKAYDTPHIEVNYNCAVCGVLLDRGHKVRIVSVTGGKTAGIVHCAACADKVNKAK